ncbi:MAG: polysaccharide deacetylase family protein [Anaerolineae bacterium]
MPILKFYFTINNVKSLLTHPLLFKIFQDRVILSGLIAAAVLLMLSLGAFIALEDTYAEAAPQQPASVLADAGIVFVQATPRAEAVTEPANAAPGMTLEAATPTPAPTPRPYYKDANEMGKVMVLMYHRIGYPETRYQRTPANFRADLQRLLDDGYYPVNFADLATGLKELPPAKKPVVLTFDDSDITQFYVLPDRTVDPDSAMGILLNFHSQHKKEWPLRATFFILGDDSGDHYKIFGQPEWAKQKLEVLVELGMEVGSHTVTHADLGMLSEDRLAWELAISQNVIEELVPDYEVQTMSVPFGGFPWTIDYLKAGQWEDYGYTYVGNAAAWGGPSVSPLNPEFDAYKISRIEVSDIWFDHWLTYFEQNPHEYFVSDGDPGRLTFPNPEDEVELAAEVSQ